jgi:DNA-binding MarR family transcriptional regulator
MEIEMTRDLVQARPIIVSLGQRAMNDDNLEAIGGRPLLRAMLASLNSFRDLSLTMPVGEVIMFLLVSLNEGDSLTELAEKADMKKSTASRYLLDLSDKTRTGDVGYGLVNRETDPESLRRNMYSLTLKGRKIVQSMTGRKETSQ